MPSLETNCSSLFVQVCGGVIFVDDGNIQLATSGNSTLYSNIAEGNGGVTCNKGEEGGSSGSLSINAKDSSSFSQNSAVVHHYSHLVAYALKLRHATSLLLLR